MRLIIAGSRDIPVEQAFRLIDEALSKAKNPITEIVSGGAKGPDTAAIQWAKRKRVQSRIFRADWGNKKSRTFNREKGYDPIAGFERNKQMASYGDALLAIHDGKSPGTEHMIKLMKELGKPVHVILRPANPPESRVTGGLMRAGVPESAAPLYKNPRPSAKSDGEGRRRAGLVSR